MTGPIDLETARERLERTRGKLFEGDKPKNGGKAGAGQGPRKNADIINAADLCKKEFAPVLWVVPGLLPAGVAILAGAPKTGKSWLALDFGIAVAVGGAVLGKVQVDPGDVLYLALEDNQRRLKSRLLKRLGTDLAPANMELATEWARIDQGAADRLNEWLIGHPAARLIIIDTLARIRPPSKAKDSLYESDYAIGAALLRLASDHDVSIVLIHHTRKGGAEDPLELISGSTGLTGGVDNVMVLQRVRGTDEASLFVTGRDIENEAKYALAWDSRMAAWTVTGEGPHVGLSPERRAVFDIIAKYGPITGRDITSVLRPGVAITKDCKEWSSVRFLLKKLTDAGLIQNTSQGYINANTTHTANTTHAAYTELECERDQGRVSGTSKTAHTSQAKYGAASGDGVSGVSDSTNRPYSEDF
jgi:hypothetical protein